MSGAQTATQAAATETTESASFLDQVVAATKQTTPDQAQDLVKTLVEQALAGTVTFDKNVTRTFDRAVAEIDRKLSEQRHHASAARDRILGEFIAEARKVEVQT